VTPGPRDVVGRVRASHGRINRTLQGFAAGRHIGDGPRLIAFTRGCRSAVGSAAGAVASRNAPLRARPTLSIGVGDQNGASFRLVYAAGNGWSIADHSGPKLAGAVPARGPIGPIQTLPDDTPRSVVVDGPTGYVFVYLIDEGWRFVGNVTDPKRGRVPARGRD